LLLSRSSPLSAASSCPLFFSFFLDGSVHHRVLHSFPTRRSSDLRVPSVRDHSVSNPEKAPAAAPRPLPESQSGWTETVRCDYQSLPRSLDPDLVRGPEPRQRQIRENLALRSR